MTATTTKMRAVWNSRTFDIEDVEDMRPPFMLNVGELRDRIAIQEFTESRTAHGGVEKTWATLETVWGRVTFKEGSETFQADQVQSGRPVTITVRHKVLHCRERDQSGWRV